MSKPFLILQLRVGDRESDDEFEAILHYGRLTKNEVKRVRMEQGRLPKIKLEDYSGIIVGGGPACVSDDEVKKPAYQKTFEKWLNQLLWQVIEQDFPYLGACFGLGPLCLLLGGKVSKKKYAEGAGPLTVKLTPEAKADPITRGLPNKFRAFAGHKESAQNLPPGAVLLASTDICPIHMIRYKKNIYATQFHPELDTSGIIVRVEVYRNHGYFPAKEADKLIELCQKEDIIQPMKILARFVARYRRE
jgi:GMP synthase (glutamine-hydrolysing)